jgi:hypothetical protein
MVGKPPRPAAQRRQLNAEVRRQPLWVQVVVACIFGFGAALVLTALIVALVLAG